MSDVNGPPRIAIVKQVESFFFLWQRKDNKKGRRSHFEVRYTYIQVLILSMRR